MESDLFGGEEGPGFARELGTGCCISAVRLRKLFRSFHHVFPVRPGGIAHGRGRPNEAEKHPLAGSKTGGAVFDPVKLPARQRGPSGLNPASIRLQPGVELGLGIAHLTFDLAAFTARGAGKQFRAQFFDVLFDAHGLRS
jgi:hypothetical protein